MPAAAFRRRHVHRELHQHHWRRLCELHALPPLSRGAWLSSLHCWLCLWACAAAKCPPSPGERQGRWCCALWRALPGLCCAVPFTPTLRLEKQSLTTGTPHRGRKSAPSSWMARRSRCRLYARPLCLPCAPAPPPCSSPGAPGAVHTTELTAAGDGVCAVGHRGAGALPDDHQQLLPRRTRHHCRLRRDRFRVVQQREAVAPRDRSVCVRGRQQAARGQQVRPHHEEAGRVQRCKGAHARSASPPRLGSTFARSGCRRWRPDPLRMAAARRSSPTG